MKHIFVHELIHKVIPHIRLNLTSDNPNKKEFDQVFRLFGEIRKKDSSRGLSALASWQPYRNKGPVIQAVEDFVELGTLYVLDPKRFELYFSEIVEGANPGLREKVGIAEVFLTADFFMIQWLRGTQ